MGKADNKAGVRSVMGVDTSLRASGVGIVELSRNGGMRAVHYEVIRNPSGWRHAQCLTHIADRLAAIVDEFRPGEAAIEGIFYCRNVRTALVLGEARGVVLAVCERSGIPVYEYSPRRVKQALVGTGAAHKQQVGRMVGSILGLEELPAEDATDALAIAICHMHGRRGISIAGPSRI